MDRGHPKSLSTDYADYTDYTAKETLKPLNTEP
jgi:hypothetical protein